jgi:hypothetical protein
MSPKCTVLSFRGPCIIALVAYVISDLVSVCSVTFKDPTDPNTLLKHVV